ncbi:MAG TPA: cytochrome c family protein [Rhizomicrobium sp.]|jgi:cytochrome c|nr:cytochrome c family protein [Rhizomicrobium sp.]
MKVFSAGVAAVLAIAFAAATGGGANAADAAKGKTVFARCAICHTTTKGGPNGIGPDLFGVVGRKAGTVPDFAYSAAMKNSGITWTPEKLDSYVAHPSAVVPGNRMAFAGIFDAGQRADVVAYLATLK